MLLKQKKRNKANEPEKKSLLQRMFIPWDLGYDWLCRQFDRSIEWTARNPIKLMLAVVAFSAAIYFLVVPQVGLSFLPFCDQGDIRIKFEFPTNYNLETTDKLVREAADHLKKYDFIKGMAIMIDKKVDMFSSKNIAVIASIMVIGIGGNYAFGGNIPFFGLNVPCIAGAAIFGIILNALLSIGEKKGEKHE